MRSSYDECLLLIMNCIFPMTKKAFFISCTILNNTLYMYMYYSSFIKKEYYIKIILPKNEHTTIIFLLKVYKVNQYMVLIVRSVIC